MEWRESGPLFLNIAQYLHFVRNLATFSRKSPDGIATESLTKEDGWYYWYRLRIDGQTVYVQNVHRFRANQARLDQFHASCVAVGEFVRRCLQSGNGSVPRNGGLFGELNGDLTDKPDPDDWIDRVGSTDLLGILNRADSLEREGDTAKAFIELQRVPSQYEYHVEVLRRRLELSWYAGFSDHEALIRWARALVEAEPFDAINWINLECAAAGPDGENNNAAAEVLREAINRHGPNFMLYYGLASRLCALNHLDDARKAMRLALQEDPCAVDSALESPCFSSIRDTILQIREAQK
jgi:hypothetical protein